MKVVRIAVILVALLAGLIAMVLARSLGGNNEPAQQAEVDEPEIELVEVLTAASGISLGTSLTAEHFTWQQWPASAAIAGYIKRGERPEADSELVGAVARSSFLSGEPIIEGKVAIAGKGFMSSILPKGYRAFATRISAETSAGGFILPKDKVDVILTEEGDKGVASETILQNVRVLAIDQTFEEQDGEMVVVGETATLELLPSQSEVLASAQQQGTLSLVLRSLEDAKKDDVQEDINSGTIVMVRTGVMTKKTVKQ